MRKIAGLVPLVFFKYLDKIFERHFQIFSDNLPQEHFWDIFAAVNRYRRIPAIIRLHPHNGPSLANDRKTKRLKKSDEIFSLTDRKHYAPGTISTSRNPTNV